MLFKWPSKNYTERYDSWKAILTLHNFLLIYLRKSNHPMKFIQAIILWAFALNVAAQPKSIHVIGYFSGNAQQVESIQTEKLTHIIFSFCHLKGNQLQVGSKDDSLTIKKLVGLKK